MKRALSLAMIGVAVAAILAVVDAATRSRIEANAQRAVVQSLIDVTGDSRVASLAGSLDPPLTICTTAGRTLYRIRSITTRGYRGMIDLLVGVDAANRLTGARVINHHETPDIGDVIETRRSAWILNFARSAAPDAVTGATITTRAVVAAVRDGIIGIDNEPATRCTHVLPD